MNRPPPSPTLFPYTTLFRSRDAGDVVTSSRSGNAADARPPPRPSGLRPAGPLAVLLAPYIPPCQRAWGPAAKCTPYFLTGPYLGLPAGPLWSPWFCGRNLLTSMAKVASLGPLAAHKVQKTVEVCLIAGTAMPRG